MCSDFATRHMPAEGLLVSSLLIQYLHTVYCNRICITVISEPHDVDVCNGTATTITCLLNSNNEGDIQWYRFMKNTSTTKMIVSHDDDFIIPTPTGNTINNSLIITNTRKSHIGYYWVKLPSFNVCNVSLTVLESMYVY